MVQYATVLQRLFSQTLSAWTPAAEASLGQQRAFRYICHISFVTQYVIITFRRNQREFICYTTASFFWLSPNYNKKISPNLCTVTITLIYIQLSFSQHSIFSFKH